MNISKKQISTSQLKMELVGKKIPMVNNRDKGSYGKKVEEWVRQSKTGRCCQWAHETAQAPDCGNIEIKMVVLKERKRGVGLYRTKEDTAITLLSAADFINNFESSHLYSKLNILWIFCMDIAGDFTVLDVIHENLQHSLQIKLDYENTRNSFFKEKRSLSSGQSDNWAIDALGQKTGGYGKSIKTKTKGPKNIKGIPRSRAFYLRARFINELVFKHFL